MNMCVKTSIQGKKGYRDSVPLKPPPHGLVGPICKGAQVLRQKEVVHQALGDVTPFSFLPRPYASISRERRTIQLEGELPQLC